MFTGIITHLGRLKEKKGSRFRFIIDERLREKIKKGESIAVNGACLTVTDIDNSIFSVDIMPETQKKTMFGELKISDSVNLELPTTIQTFLSGHIVQGHVDGVGTIRKIKNQGNSKILTIAIPKDLARYIVEKGSIAVNGISLTVIEVLHDSFTVGIVPFTLKHTVLNQSKVGDLVNIEVDILAKYIEKLASYEKK